MHEILKRLMHYTAHIYIPDTFIRIYIDLSISPRSQVFFICVFANPLFTSEVSLHLIKWAVTILTRH